MVLQDVDLKYGAEAGYVGQGVLDDVEGVQTLLRAHQHHLKWTGRE